MSDKSQKTIKIGTLVLLLTITSKLVAFLRDIVFSAIFGTSIYADAYFAANIVPGLLNTTLTVSLLVFFIPIYTEKKINIGDEAANDFSSNLLTIYPIVSVILTAVVIVFAEPLIRLTSPGFSGEVLDLAIKLLRFSCLSFPITMVTYVFINISNANQKYLTPQFLGILNGSITIIAMLLLSKTFGIYIVPIAGLFSWIFQIFIQGRSISDVFNYKFQLNIKDEAIKRILILALPVIISTGTEQINLTINNILCSNLAQGSISTLNYAQKILNMINGTLTTALITVMYPIFSVMYSKNEIRELYNTINKCARVLFLVLVPVTIICFIGSQEIIELIYFRGKFSTENVQNVSHVFVFYSLGITFLALKELYTRTFYIFNDSRTPTTINVVCILINIILSLILINHIGIVGLALATSISYFCSFVLERQFVWKKFGDINKETNKKIVIDIAIASFALFLTWNFLNPYLIKYPSAIELLLSTAVGIAVYIFVLFITKNDEIYYLIQVIKKRTE